MDGFRAVSLKRLNRSALKLLLMILSYRRQTWLMSGFQKMDLDEILAVADYLSIHVPLIDDTYHLINEGRLKQMKRNAVIINTARGPIIDEKALTDALEKGIIAGAALDVTENEPVSIESPLLTMDNVIITPHSAWYSEEAMVELRQKAARNIVQVLTGEKNTIRTVLRRGKIMKIATFSVQSEQHIGLVQDDQIISLTALCPEEFPACMKKVYRTKRRVAHTC
ncbi:NAD(P)-dependent oxidoreductase [Peribacillus frigoritolerans]|nr:NAD(P)-dependent oxidoreductase [Peribacillus frigoritolerans]